MKSSALVIDIRERGELPAHTYAFYQLRELKPGDTVELLLDEEPELTMESVSLQLRHQIHWEVVEAGPPLWLVQVRHRDDVAATRLMDLLERDHLRLDRLFAQALHRVNTGDVAGAAPFVKEFAAGLRRHLYAENDILAPAFVGPRDPHGMDPTSIMLREHDQILEQTQIIEAYFEDELPDAAEVAPFFALLSGQLAKHETREEQGLFPQWEMALKKAGGSEQALVERIAGVLRGEEDARAGITS